MSGEDSDSLRSLILTFRLAELQQLIGFAGGNKYGKKNDLQARALELVGASRNPNITAKVQELYKQAQESQSLGLSQGNMAHSVYMQQQNQQQASAIQQALQSGRGLQSSLPAAPAPAAGVKLKRLPFYNLHGELVAPAVLEARGSGRFQEAQLQFLLSMHQANLIATNRDISPESKLEYLYQVQVRFCPRDSLAEQADEFPPSICVQVNGKMFPLPNPVPGKNNTEPKRPPKAVDISKMCKLTPSLPNTIHVKWASDSGKGWVMAVNLVEKLTSSQLLERLVQKGTRDSAFTRELIKKKLTDDEDGIATTNLKVTVACPLGKMRMAAPCRPATCDHLQCFDAHLFIQMNERKPTWQCPVCDGAALYDSLMVDGYFLDVINSADLPEEDNEIILGQDGSWHPMPKNEDEERISRERAEREKRGLAEASDDEGSFGKPDTPLAKEVDVIDLDSD